MARKVLTVEAVKQAKPGNSRREIPDAKAPGLYLVIQPTAEPGTVGLLDGKSWAFRYRFRGAPKKLTLGKVLILDQGEEEPETPRMDGPLTISGARRLAREAANQVASDIDPAHEKQRQKDEARARVDADLDTRDLFETVARVFIERYARKKNRAWVDTARLLGLKPEKTVDEKGEAVPPEKCSLVLMKGGLAEKWSERRIQHIGRPDINSLLDGIVDSGRPIAANRTLAAVRRLMNWSIERGYIEVSPCAGIRPPSSENPGDRILSDDEIRWLWKACEERGSPFGPFVECLLLLGQRRDETSGMRERELDRSEAVWTIPRDRAKNGVEHTVPLSDAALEAIGRAKRIRGRAGYVFSTTGDAPISGYSRAKANIDAAMLKAAQKEAIENGIDPDSIEIAPWKLHDLRRTAASGMARLGQPVHVVEALLNHKSGTISGVAAVYLRYDFAAEKRRAVEAWGRYVTALVEGKPASNVRELREIAS